MKSFLIFISLLASGTRLLLAQNNIPNPGFEEWDSSSLVNPKYYEPKGWSTLNRYFIDTNRVYTFRSTEAHSGKYSLLLTPTIDSTLSPFRSLSVVKNGRDSLHPLVPRDDIGYSSYRYFKLTGKPKKLKGWYKYIPDSPLNSKVLLSMGTITVQDFPNIIPVGGAYTEQLAPAPTFQAFELPYIEDVPGASIDSGSIILSFFSKNHSLSPQGKFWLDDLEIEYENATAVAEQKKTEMKIYPNPVSNEVSFYSQNGAIVELSLLDATGREFYKAYPGVAKIQVDMIAFPSGVYHAHIKHGDHIEVMKVVKF